MDQITSFWKGLSNRERTLMSALGLFVIGYIVYRFVWMPLDDALDRRIIRVQDKIDQYAALSTRVESTKRALALQDDQLTARFEGNAMVAVEESVSAAGLKDQLNHAAPAGDSVSVAFNNVDFNRWLEWVATMRERGIIVNEAKIATVNGREGIVTIKALVRPVR